MIRKRVRLREALLPSDGRWIVEAIGYLPLFRLVLRNEAITV
jgi:hypothetical protein